VTYRTDADSSTSQQKALDVPSTFCQRQFWLETDTLLTHIYQNCTTPTHAHMYWMSDRSQNNITTQTCNTYLENRTLSHSQTVVALVISSLLAVHFMNSDSVPGVWRPSKQANPQGQWVCLYGATVHIHHHHLLHLRLSRRLRKMYCGHTCLCVWLSVCLRPYTHTTARTRI